MTNAEDLIDVGNEFYVKKDWPSISSSGVFFRIETVDDDYVVLKHDGMGPDEIDVPKNKFKDAIDNGTLEQRERDPELR